MIVARGSVPQLCLSESLNMLAPLPRFLTNPDTPGTEKLVISACRPDANICPPHTICNADICYKDKKGLAPMNLMYVKGWSRSVAALTVLVCMWQCPEFKQAGRFICYLWGSLFHCLFLEFEGLAGISTKDLQCCFLIQISRRSWARTLRTLYANVTAVPGNSASTSLVHENRGVE